MRMPHLQYRGQSGGIAVPKMPPLGEIPVPSPVLLTVTVPGYHTEQKASSYTYATVGRLI